MNYAAYAERGYACVPIPRGSKAPTFADWPRRVFRAEEFWDGCNVGLKLGAPSGGLVDVDLDAPEAVEAAHLILPATGMVSGRKSKPSSHWWYQTDNPPAKASTKFADVDGATLVELRSTGGQTLVPPSVHPGGEPLTWTTFGEPARVEAAALRDRVAELASLALLARHWPGKGQRHDATLALAGGLLRGGWDVDRVDGFLSALLTLTRDEEFRAREANLRTTAERLARGGEATGWPRLGDIVGAGVTERVCEWLNSGTHRRAAAGDEPENWEAFDDGFRLARTFAKHRYDGHLRFWRGEFWRWDGKRYVIVADNEITGAVTGFIKTEFDRYAAAEWRREQAAHREAVRAGAQAEAPRQRPTPKVSQGIVSSTLLALRSEGMTLLGDSVTQPSWIGKPEVSLVALDNGLIDIQKLLDGRPELIPHSPEWFSPTCLPYPFEPEAKCPKWLAFLERAMEGDPERIALLQEWAGYNLIHDTSLHKFMMLEGGGANGKSVYCAGLIAMLGSDNVSSVGLESFGDQFALYCTLGKLANISTDMDETDKTAEGVLKQMADGSPMTFDRKYKDPVTAQATARCTFATNTKPVFRDKSDGLWRRMLYVLFRVTIKEGERVPGMDNPAWWLRSGEVPGVFLWAVAGLRRLRANLAFTTPVICREAMARYRQDCNPVALYLEDRCITSEGQSVPCGALYADYRAWCAENGYKALSNKQFGKELHRAGCGERQKLGGRDDRVWCYLGVGLPGAPCVQNVPHASV